MFAVHGVDHNAKTVLIKPKLPLAALPESSLVRLLRQHKVAIPLTVLMQYTKGMEALYPETGSEVSALLESSKRYIWHSNVIGVAGDGGNGFPSADNVTHRCVAGHRWLGINGQHLGRRETGVDGFPAVGLSPELVVRHGKCCRRVSEAAVDCA